MVPRLATAPVALGGVTLPAGALVHLCVSAAHRDPLRFDEPHEIRLTRRSVRHFTFGSGIHHCVGATVGRRTINIAVQTLLARAPHFRAGERLDRIPYFSTMTANAAERLLIDTNIDRVTR
jgi:cytochrome P450